MQNEALVFFLGAAAGVVMTAIARKRLLAPFLCSAVTGLLSLVGAVCLAPLFGVKISFNFFTATCCFFLGPPGAAGLLALARLWQ